MMRCYLISSLIYISTIPPFPVDRQVSAKPPACQASKTKVLPVLLTVDGHGKDSVVVELFQQAFSANGVRLISEDEMQRRISHERRVITKRLRKQMRDNPEDDLRRAIAQEMVYVTNKLTISIVLETNGDSLKITEVNWSNIPLPVNDYKRNIYTGRVNNIGKKDLPTSLKESIYHITGLILSSRQLE